MSSEGVELTQDEEAELSEALAEIQRGEFHDGFALLQEIEGQADSGRATDSRGRQ